LLKTVYEATIKAKHCPEYAVITGQKTKYEAVTKVVTASFSMLFLWVCILNRFHIFNFQRDKNTFVTAFRP
jgi:hypothetical protein